MATNPGNSSPNQEPGIAVLKQRLLKEIRRSVYVYRIDCGGCNGCEIEIFASLTPLFDVERFGIKVVPSPRHADILVYTGPMTRAMRLPALRAYNAAPDPKLVVAYGACGYSGGIFHDSYAVWGGASAFFPIDLLIPGCPPTPGATIHGFATALGLLQQKIKAEHQVEQEAAAPELPDPAFPLQLRREIEQEARRLCGYWQGKAIAAQYLDLAATGDPAAHDLELQSLLQSEQDKRRREVFSRLHRFYLGEAESTLTHRADEHER